MSNILKDIISSQSTVLIIPHQSPDGDCLGSSFSLSNFFTRNNCFHFVVMDEIVPTNYKFLELPLFRTSDDILKMNLKFDYIVILDTSSLDRVGASKEVLQLSQHKVVIDHHKTNDYFGDTNIVQMTSSVGELLYRMYQSIGYEIDINDAIGLYTSIVTDTGEFRYSNTTAETLVVASKLFETGFNFQEISQTIFSNKPLKKVLLNSQSLSEMNRYGDGKVVIMTITQDMLRKLECDMFHSDGIVEAGREIENVEVSVLIKEIESNVCKVSMRSKSYVDVSDISLIFGGGGHSRAAGCTVNENIHTTEEIIAKEILKRL